MEITLAEKRIRNNEHVRQFRLRKKHPELYAKECALCHTREGVKSKYCVPCRQIAKIPEWKKKPRVCKTCGIPTEGKRRYCEPHRIEADRISRSAIRERAYEKILAARPMKQCERCLTVSREVKRKFCKPCGVIAHAEWEKEHYRKTYVKKERPPKAIREYVPKVKPIFFTSKREEKAVVLPEFPEFPKREEAPKPIKIFTKEGHCTRCESRLKVGEEKVCDWCQGQLAKLKQTV